MAPSPVPDIARRHASRGEPARAGFPRPSPRRIAAAGCAAALLMAGVASSQRPHSDAAGAAAAAPRPFTSPVIPRVRLSSAGRGTTALSPIQRGPFAFAGASVQPGAPSPVPGSVESLDAPVITSSPIPQLIGFASENTPAGVRHTAVLLTDGGDLWLAQEGGTWGALTASQITEGFVDLRNQDSGRVTRLVLD